MTQSRGRRPMHRSFRRRARRVLKRKSLKLLAWCKLVLVNIAFGFMTQVVACRACLLKLWSCKEAGPPLKLPKPEQCPRPCLPSSLSLDLNALPEKRVLLRVTHALCAWAAQVHMSTRDWSNLSHQFCKVLCYLQMFLTLVLSVVVLHVFVPVRNQVSLSCFLISLAW